MLDETDLQACALQVIRQYGYYADRAVARRIAEYASRNEHDGVAMWRAIDIRVNQLREPAAGQRAAASFAFVERRAIPR